MWKTEPEVLTSAPQQQRIPRGRNPEFEAALGVRIRAARVAAGLSQTALGTLLSITFQQVQKYESGKDRVAASTLQGIAAALGVHPGSFYDATPVPTGRVPKVRSATKAAEVLQQIRSPRVLKRLLALAQALVDADDDEIKPNGSAEHP